VTEQFIAILEEDDEDKMLAFLRGLSPDDKKSLVPQIKKSAKKYNEFGPLKVDANGSGTYGHIHGTNTQRALIQLASFVCFNRGDYEKSPADSWILNKEHLSKVIDWYCPSWFGEYVNKLATRDFIPYSLNYDWIMELNGRGVLEPSKELIVKTLPQAIFRQTNGNSWEFYPALLLKYPITLESHVWNLFELESNLHYSNRWLNFGDKASQKKLDWILLFKTFTQEGRIDRLRVLQESLLASNRNFNKTLSGWFAQLFIELEPTKEELLQLQKELFSVLGSPQSKPVSIALQGIKKILAEKEFETDILLDTMPVLLTSDTKSTVNTSLMIMEKLAQKHPNHHERVALLACQSFIRSDDELQTRAAKLIEKYGDPANAELRAELTAYQQSMLSSARNALSAYIAVDVAGKADVDGQNSEGWNSDGNKFPAVPSEWAAPPQELTKILFPANIDDLVFLASQAFDNNEPWHFDVLPAALLQFSQQLQPEDIPRFEAAFQRALKGNSSSTAGTLDYLLSLFFIDYGNWLIRKFPVAGESIHQVYKSFDRKEGEKSTSFLVSPKAGSYIAGWESQRETAFYFPFQQLLLDALGRIQRGSSQPLLSTPTHEPCWIETGVLIDRLHECQQSGQEPGGMDLQLALSRCRLLDVGAAELEKTGALLQGEFRELMRFLLDEASAPRGPFSHRAAWMVASLTRKQKKEWPAFDSFSYRKVPFSRYTGQLQWRSIAESYVHKEFDYTTRKYKEIASTRKLLIVEREYAASDGPFIKKLFSKWLPTSKEDPPMLYDFLNYRLKYIVAEHNDIRRVMGLTPHNPEPILADTITKCLKFPEFWEEGDKKMVKAVAQFLYEEWEEPGEMSYLFLGTCLLSVDKTILHTAGEIWLKAVSKEKIDNAVLGRVIGLHESIEFAPLKRFTDLLTQNLFRVSSLHDRELQVLLEHILMRLPDEPIKHLKKLLEMYGELLALNGASAGAVGSGDLKVKLQVWEKNAGLKKIAAEVLAR